MAPDLKKPNDERLTAGQRQRGEDFLRFLDEEIWQSLAADVAGRTPTRKEKEQLLGYGPEGV